ncbi:MAG: YeeE/YedE family protein [Peredibacter sp.]|nr:YeeE/YedE family protein [Peredibacter sp.]
MTLILGLLTGFVFGFLLQKGRVAKHDVIIKAFLLKDFTAAKIMATAGAVGAVGFYTFNNLGYIELQIKPAELGAIIFGGVLFGIGIVFYGYCPGTGVSAVGEGHKDALVGMLGMLIGGLFYVITFPFVQAIRKDYPDIGKETLPSITESSPLLWVVGFTLVISMIAFAARRKQRRVYE